MVEVEVGVGVDLFDIVEELIRWSVFVEVEQVVGVVTVVEIELEPSVFNVEGVTSVLSSD